jgi:hypothetical protein
MDCRQGGHHDAKKSIKTILPLKSDSATVFPSKSFNLKSLVAKERSGEYEHETKTKHKTNVANACLNNFI